MKKAKKLTKATTTDPKVIKVLIEDLVYDPDNANKMEPEEYDQLVANIKTVGAMLQPILVKEAEGDDTHFAVVDGEHRAKASAEAGLTHVLAVVWDGTEAMRKALAIGFNRIRGELDLTKVQRVLTALSEDGWGVSDMMMTGFKEEEITDLLAMTNDISPDDIMENPVEAGSGDGPAVERPLVLELTFATSAELKFAKKSLRRAAGKGIALGQGLLTILGHEE